MLPIVFFGAIVTVAIAAPCFFAVSAIFTRLPVVPDPEPDNEPIARLGSAASWLADKRDVKSKVTETFAKPLAARAGASGAGDKNPVRLKDFFYHFIRVFLGNFLGKTGKLFHYFT